MEEQAKEHRQLLETWIGCVAQRDEATVDPRSDLHESLAGLEANKVLVQHLTSTRWFVILRALEAGADWDELSAAVGLSRGAVWALFCRQTDRLVSGSRDAARADAVKDPLRGRRYQ